MMVITIVVFRLIVYFVTYAEYSICLSNHTEILVPLLGKLGILRMREEKQSDNIIRQRKFLTVNNI